MKKMILCGVMFLSAIAFDAKSQVGLSVNVNIGSQPAWGPVGYDYVEYYYLPDVEAYYYVPKRQFIYLAGDTWVHSYSLPPAYRNYDLYNGYKVVVNEPRPFRHFKADRIKYATYKGNHSQVIIRNSNETKYYVVKGHPKYKAVNKNNGNKNRGKGRH
jgi:hypothetical protein